MAAWVVVLNGAADRAGRRGTFDRTGGAGRLGAIAVLKIDRNRQLRRPVQRRRVLAHLLERGTAVTPAKRERKAGTRAGERLEPECREHTGRARIPRVRDHKRLTGMQ